MSPGYEVPQVACALLDALCSGPSQLLDRSLVGCNTRSNVASPAWGHIDWDGLIGCGLQTVDCFLHGGTIASPQVESAERLRDFCAESSDVTSRQVGDMDEVPDCGSIPGFPVTSKDVKLLSLASQDLGDDREQVCRHTLGVLAQEAGRVASDGVKVSQCNNAPKGIGERNISKDGLTKVLGSRVGAEESSYRGHSGLLLAVLVDEGLGMVNEVLFLQGASLVGLGSIDGGRRRENKVADVVLAEELDELDESAHVVAVVLDRLGDGVADRLVGGKVNDASNPRLSCKSGRSSGRAGCGRDEIRVRFQEETHRLAAVVDLVKVKLGHGDTIALAVILGQSPHPGKDTVEGIAEVVDNNDIVSGLQELKRSV